MELSRLTGVHINSLQEHKDLIIGGLMTTSTLELALAWPRTTHNDDILDIYDLEYLAYVEHIHIYLPLLKTLLEH